MVVTFQQESFLLCYEGVLEQFCGRRPVLRLGLEAPEDEVLALAAQLLGHVGVHLVVADLVQTLLMQNPWQEVS